MLERQGDLPPHKEEIVTIRHFVSYCNENNIVLCRQREKRPVAFYPASFEGRVEYLGKAACVQLLLLISGKSLRKVSCGF